MTSVRFPSLEASAIPPMEQLLRSLIPDRRRADICRASAGGLDCTKATSQTVAVKNDSPELFYSTAPSLLQSVAGDPVLAPARQLGAGTASRSGPDAAISELPSIRRRAFRGLPQALAEISHFQSAIPSIGPVRKAASHFAPSSTMPSIIRSFRI